MQESSFGSVAVEPGRAGTISPQKRGDGVVLYLAPFGAKSHGSTGADVEIRRCGRPLKHNDVDKNLGPERQEAKIAGTAQRRQTKG